jgi:DNA polymerase-4
MDAFYAAVELLDDPALADRPVVVGGTGRRGVVASCSYEARAYGVRSAMPSARARQLCPHAVFLPGRFARYAEVSRSIHAVFEDYTPLVEGISLDEAFLDVSGSERMFGPAAEIAISIRSRIRSELGLPCSVGVAGVKFLAKLASEAAKPRADLRGVVGGPGVVVIQPGQELDFLRPLPIEALWGVGPATAARLKRLGVTTVGELMGVPENVLQGAVGRAHGAHLAQLARGVDDRDVEPNREVKSVSHEETYAVDLHDLDQLGGEVVRMADSVATRMRRAGLVGRTVNLKVRYGDFVTRTRSQTVAFPLAEGPAIASVGLSLLHGMDVAAGVRLLGVGVSNLAAGDAATAEQLHLDLGANGVEPPNQFREASQPREASQVPVTGWRSAAGAVEEVRTRFGDDAVGPASLLRAGTLRIKRPGDTQWGPTTDDQPPDDRTTDDRRTDE